MNKIANKLLLIKNICAIDIDNAKTIKELLFLQEKYLGDHSILIKVINNKLIKQQLVTFSSFKFLKIICDYISRKIKYVINKNYPPLYNTLLSSQNSDRLSMKRSIGNLHHITIVSDYILKHLENLGFELTSGPDLEHPIYNFDKLAINYYHPSRKLSDTFYIRKNILLRTHTSSIQIRILSILKKIPIRIISYGNVYRKDEDATHSPMFSQIEGLYIDKYVGFSHLKGILIKFIYNFFLQRIKIRWRNSNFPFTEPSCEIDLECCKCIGYGCAICTGSGWIEVMGAGIVSPIILKRTGFNNTAISGFAFGLGIERFSMIYYKVENIKFFFENILQLLYIF